MFDEVIARPGHEDEGDELLSVHSDEVAVLAPQFSSDDVAPIVEVVGRLHDLGKATTFFQKHVRDKYVEHERHTYHARLSALATFHVLSELGVSERNRLAGLLAVLRHHGRLPDAAEKLAKLSNLERAEKRSAYLHVQVDDIAQYSAGRAVADALLRNASDGTSSWESFAEALSSGRLYEEGGELIGTVDRWFRITPDAAGLPDHLYDRTIQVWSSLTLADKTCSAGLAGDERLTPRPLSLDDLDAAIESKRVGLGEPPMVTEETRNFGGDVTDQERLNQLREGIRRYVRTNARRFATGDERVATLTLPTGLGKTFTGLTAAYTIRDSIDHVELGESHEPRVIYALPYTSVIEQTRTVFEDALGANPLGRAFTVHHYLSDTVTFPDVQGANGDKAIDDTDYFDASRFGESWRAGTILTTFVQLFESLSGPTNARGLKLPALRDSVVVLDEPQTLPKRWWPAIRYLIELLVTEYDAHVISMTATQPSLFTEAPFETISLLSRTRTKRPPIQRACFEAVERTTYHIDESLSAGTNHETAVAHDAAGDRIVTDVLAPDTPSAALAVCNTIASTAELRASVQSASQGAGVETRHIGDVYRDVLESTESTGSHSGEFDPDLLSDRPTPDDVASKVLTRLGFEATDHDGDRVSEWTWVPVGASDDLLVAEFSSRFRPRDRRVLITVADAIASTDRPFVFVSTQAIEAGVDISFGSVYRDIAPLDSVVQAAGRCNRSFEWGGRGGRMTVWKLAPTDGAAKPPSSYVYSPTELTRVAEILDEFAREEPDRSLSDTTVETEAVRRYFEWVETEGGPDVEDRDLTRALEQCQGDVLASRSLISPNYETRDVLVAHTPLERAAIERLTTLLQEGQKNPRSRAAGLDILNRLSDIRVSIPLEKLEGLSSVTRLDGRTLGDPDGVDVLHLRDGGENRFYDLANGGLRITDVIPDRFTV